MRMERQTDTCYPAYLAYVGTKAVCWIELAQGRKNGWCVHLCKFSPGEEGSCTMWHYHFKDAKAYAKELCDIEAAD